MNNSSASLKSMARAALAGKWGKAAVFSVLITLITSALTLCTMPFESSTSVLGITIYLVITLIISLISGLFGAGTSYFYLNICRGLEFKYSDLFYAFKHNPDRFLIVAFITGLPTFLSTIPGFFMNPVTEEDLIMYSVVTLVSLYIGSIISIFISLFFALSNYLLLDFDELGAIDSLRMSAYLMKGNKWRYFYISLSFVGWIFVGLFTLGIAFLWIEPYMSMTFTYFYADILNRHQPNYKEPAADVVYGQNIVPAEPVEESATEPILEPVESEIVQEEAIIEENPQMQNTSYSFENQMVDDDLFED